MRLGPFFQRSGDRSAPGADGFFSCVFHVKRRMRRPASRRGRSARRRRLACSVTASSAGAADRTRRLRATATEESRGEPSSCSLGAGRAARIPSRADHRSAYGRHRASSLVPGTAGTRSDEGRVRRRVSRETAGASEPTGRARAGRTGLGFAGPRVCRSIADRARHRPGGVRPPGRPGERCRVIDGGANESAASGPGMLSRAAQPGPLAGLLTTVPVRRSRFGRLPVRHSPVRQCSGRHCSAQRPSLRCSPVRRGAAQCAWIAHRRCGGVPYAGARMIG